jgi:CubicO group peptidase (beta-lactamase class C family)
MMNSSMIRMILTLTQTIQAIGSLSKAFTAAALGVLMDDFANGRNATSLPPGVSDFAWDTKLAQLLPEEWQLMDQWASQKVSIRDALSHMSGLPT